METEPPLCSCHQEAMYRNGIDPSGSQKWRCAVRDCERDQAKYDNLSGYAYNLKLLRMRRAKALLRKRKREVDYGPLQA